MLFHGTLTVWGQLVDELPMVWYLLMSLYIVNRDFIGDNPTAKLVSKFGLPIYGVLFSALHVMLRTTTAFQVHFGALVVLLLGRMYLRFRLVDAGPHGRWAMGALVGSLLAGTACWLVDYHHCSWFQARSMYPLGHMWWHLFMGYAAYYSVAALRIMESREAGKPLHVAYALGLPFARRALDVSSLSVADCALPSALASAAAPTGSSTGTATDGPAHHHAKSHHINIDPF